MARNERYLPVSPGSVFEVLADARQYGYVVAGSKEIRDSDPRWPRKGAKFQHTVGYGLLTVEDTTHVVGVDPPQMLRVVASAKLLGTAEVTFELEAEDGGTRVTMVEDPVVPKVFWPLTLPVHVFTRLRNRETLRRLAEVAEASPAQRGRIARREGSA
ncbi:MAG: SRPBCC family protein [Actinomycetota bacterium]|nr:SRPBCC family protein [Actinomycetota bacterium]MDQ3720849.1 SRPBCC family protein [Actinomycetota bacterium]